MDESAPGAGGMFGRVAILAVSSIAIVFGAGVIAGILAAHADDGGGPFDPRLIAIVAGIALAMTGAGWAALRAFRAMARAGGRPTARERRGRLTIIAAALTGMLIAAVLIFFDPTAEGIFSNAPLPAGVALALALIIAVPVPIASYYWHRRIVDEQESNAFRTGAMLGLYAFWLAAPAWWLLWRGGLAPAPDGFILYFLTHLVAGIGWMWGKYR